MTLKNKLRINLSRNIGGVLKEHLGLICGKCYRTYDYQRQLGHADPIFIRAETFIYRKIKSYNF